jgi:hypothetical protein
MDNPFLCLSRLNLPLQVDICQRIHCAALRFAARGGDPEKVPQPTLLKAITQQSRFQGPEAFLSHPATLEQRFDGVTLAVYQAVEALYCSRLERSIPMVYRIISKMAEQAQIPPINYEAIWAICLFLAGRHQESTECRVEVSGTTWQLVQLKPEVRLQKAANGGVYRPTLLCLVETQSSRVLAFRVTEETRRQEAIGLAIYEAITAGRKPAPFVPTALVWSLPARLITELELPQITREVLSLLGIELETKSMTTQVVQVLQQGWDRDLAGRVLPERDFELIFDHHLGYFHHYSPRETQKDLEREFTYRVGYNQDPAWQFPKLRGLLAKREGLISAEGDIEDGRLHYEDPLLHYWPGCPVTLRRSAYGEATAWVYLEGEILCQAIARELRRTDGTYRLNRPKGE